MFPFINFQTFVYDNDLFYQKDPFTTATRVTHTGKKKIIFNGIPDWVYEGKCLSRIGFSVELFGLGVMGVSGICVI